jgi:hypothetical protein
LAASAYSSARQSSAFYYSRCSSPNVSEAIAGA